MICLVQAQGKFKIIKKNVLTGDNIAVFYDYISR